MATWYDRVGGIGYGGDYNPDQWPQEVQDDDLRLMREAGVTVVSVAVFSWARLQPDPGSFDFRWLDDLLDRLHDNGIAACLGTATATPPAWMAHLYPDTLPVTQDGVRISFGSRGQFCPSSTPYRTMAAALVTRLAQRYADHPAVAMWHVGNEYSGECYCDTTAAAFRRWLQDRYGNLAGLNDAWGTHVWSQHYRDWEEITPPRRAMWNELRNPSQRLDFMRFTSDELLGAYTAEVDLLRELSPGVPVLTNFMESYKWLDYWKWAAVGDAVSLDSYPDPGRPQSHVGASFNYDLMRSLGDGKPWLLLEQAVTAVAFRSVNQVKTAPRMRLGSYQAIAHGAEAAMAFQWRASRTGPEKFQTGMIPQAGENSRSWRGVKRLGTELATLAELAGTRPAPARVAVVWDYENWWALEQPGRPAALDYLDQVMRSYTALWNQNITVDLVHPLGDLGGYRLLVVPNLYLATDSAIKNIESFVEQGGHLVVCYFSDIVDDTDALPPQGYTTRLRDVLGIVVEDFSPLRPGQRVDLVGPGQSAGQSPGHGTDWQEILHLTQATALMTYGSGELAGEPAVTRNTFGLGTATYCSTTPDEDTLARLLGQAARDAGVRPLLDTPDGVEAVARIGPAYTYLFLLNHTDSPAQVVLDHPATDLLTGRLHTAGVDVAGADLLILRYPNPPSQGAL